MADNTNSPLSWQTTMPEYPDVSYDTWAKQNTFSTGSRLWNSFEAFMYGEPSYKQWRENLLDKYNAQLSAYNTWLQSGAGMKASAESGQYNPSYFQNSPASASPLSYQQLDDASGFSEMAQGVSGIMQFATALQGLKYGAEQIAGQKLKNEAQKINNDYLARVLEGRVVGLNLKNDKSQFEIEQLFYPRWSERPELWKNGVFSPYGRATYDLRDAEKGLGYQRAVADLDYLKAGKILRDSQEALYNASAREKKWFYDNVKEFQKEIIENQAKILKGEFNFQQVEQKLRKRSINANIGIGVANAAVNAIKTFLPSGLLSGSTIAPSIQAPSWNYPYSPSWSGGVDILNGEYYNSYRPY